MHRLTRRSFLLGAAAAGAGCAGLSSGGGAHSGWVGASHWTVPLLGTMPSRVLVWRCTGDPSGSRLEGMFEEVGSSGSAFGPIDVGLGACSQSEHYFAGLERISVLRNVPPTLDPASMGRWSDRNDPNIGRECRTQQGPTCLPRWTLAGAATSGTRRYTADEGTLFVLPDHAWVYANGPAAVRLGDALARDSRAVRGRLTTYLLLTHGPTSRAATGVSVTPSVSLNGGGLSVRF